MEYILIAIYSVVMVFYGVAFLEKRKRSRDELQALRERVEDLETLCEVHGIFVDGVK